MKIWTCRSSPRSESRNAWTRIKNVNSVSRLSNLWNFFGANQTISCRDWWPWKKPGYITKTRRQSNKEKSGGIEAHSASPKKSQCKNWLENFSPRFFGIKTASSSLIVLKRAKLSTRSITYLYWCNWRTFWRKNEAGSSPRWSCSSTTMPSLTEHLQPRRNWPTWASSLLFIHPILQIWPHWTTTRSLDWKTIERLPFFFRNGGHYCRGDLVGRTTFWFFLWVACKS